MRRVPKDDLWHPEILPECESITASSKYLEQVCVVYEWDQTSGSHDVSHLVQTVIFFFDVPILLLIFSYLQDT